MQKITQPASQPASQRRQRPLIRLRDGGEGGDVDPSVISGAHSPLHHGIISQSPVSQPYYWWRPSTPSARKETAANHHSPDSKWRSLTHLCRPLRVAPLAQLRELQPSVGLARLRLGGTCQQLTCAIRVPLGGLGRGGGGGAGGRVRGLAAGGGAALAVGRGSVPALAARL